MDAPTPRIVAGRGRRSGRARAARCSPSSGRRRLHSTRTLFVSRDEWLRFAALAPECATRTGWVENGVDRGRFSPGLAFDDPFTDRWAAHRVHRHDGLLAECGRRRLVRARGDAAAARPFPGPSFHIVGANPGRELRRLAEHAPDVFVTGRVADTRPYIAHADVVVAPLQDRARHPEQGSGGDGDGASRRRLAAGVRGRPGRTGPRPARRRRRARHGGGDRGCAGGRPAWSRPRRTGRRRATLRLVGDARRA